MRKAILLDVESPVDLNTVCPAARLVYRGQTRITALSDAGVISEELGGVVREAGFGGSHYAVDVILPSGTPNAETLLSTCLEKLGYDINS